jgi:hypothetical protein
LILKFGLVNFETAKMEPKFSLVASRPSEENGKEIDIEIGPHLGLSSLVPLPLCI